MAENSRKAADKAKHLKRHCWKKGQSGNPGGRSKKNREIEKLAQDALAGGESGCVAIDTLKSIMDNKSAKDSDRLTAIKMLMSYAYGTPRDIESRQADGDTSQKPRAIELHIRGL